HKEPELVSVEEPRIISHFVHHLSPSRGAGGGSMHEHHRNVTGAVGTYHEKPVFDGFLAKKFEITAAESSDLKVPNGRALQRVRQGRSDFILDGHINVVYLHRPGRIGIVELQLRGEFSRRKSGAGIVEAEKSGNRNFHSRRD